MYLGCGSIVEAPAPPTCTSYLSCHCQLHTLNIKLLDLKLSSSPTSVKMQRIISKNSHLSYYSEVWDVVIQVAVLQADCFCHHHHHLRALASSQLTPVATKQLKKNITCKQYSALISHAIMSIIKPKRKVLWWGSLQPDLEIPPPKKEVL